MRALIVVLGAGLIACTDPVDSDSLDFEASRIESERTREWSVAQVETGHHRIRVRRVAEAIGDCEQLGADLLRTGRTLTLRVRDPARRGDAEDLVSCGYTAVIDQVPPGNYTLRVVHSSAAIRSGSRVVLDQPIHLR